jgi:hypothetical protein
VIRNECGLHYIDCEEDEEPTCQYQGTLGSVLGDMWKVDPVAYQMWAMRAWSSQAEHQRLPGLNDWADAKVSTEMQSVD